MPCRYRHSPARSIGGLPDLPLLEFLNDLHPPLDDDDRPRHRLLGYPDPLQNDPWEHLDGPATAWQFLAQIDSEPDAALGDNGLIYVFIPADGDLSRARAIFQMH
jgi:hypothetical protein